MISKTGYPVETHHVQTKDGYILALHRIKHGKYERRAAKKKVVLVMHGVLMSSADYVLGGENKSLGELRFSRTKKNSLSTGRMFEIVKILLYWLDLF